MPFANRCCGDPDCGYARRLRVQATYPELRRPLQPAPRWLTLGSWLLALAALIGCVGIGLRVVIG